MTMNSILQVATSSVLLIGAAPAYTCEHVSPDPQFHFGSLVFDVGGNGQAELGVDSSATDALDFLNGLIKQHGLESEMPAARKWVAEEFYPGEQTLSSLRLNRGFTQLELANKIGVPQSTIARIETGNNTPSVERAGEIAHALGVSLDEYYAAFKVSRQGKSV
ncbi:helix-turn-helix transcriptional regulator [Alcaligenes faecalis]|uniref:helix-turn-helix transcriptional regulator n=2 Tax=Pseudomonadota TaxID=1224 RepID=UPI0006C39362|nr:helix-turn-helix transcriptional regulator [Alcaligenes faecalis]MCX5593559.1 helix-turn-helix transcriptional regulator [Alcaligenes faecalis]GAU71916.1 XRE family transcriptional regulator [Alcaligenes faecalis subsp. faecalis NBRC 13111]CAJ0905680.1 protein of unknown function [Alcaligenes faecalis subsp. faecalis]CUI43595.1 transcriptional regulator%2C y4mF family [Alcaligenes faecalis]